MTKETEKEKKGINQALWEDFVFRNNVKKK